MHSPSSQCVITRLPVSRLIPQQTKGQETSTDSAKDLAVPVVMPETHHTCSDYDGFSLQDQDRVKRETFMSTD